MESQIFGPIMGSRSSLNRGRGRGYDEVIIKEKKGHRLFRCPLLVTLGWNCHAGRVRCLSALLHRGYLCRTLGQAVPAN